MKPQPIEQFYRYCPHCSTEIAQLGVVPFRCPECGFANFFGPVAAVGALVFNEQNQLLLVRRARNPGRGMWGLPGGFVDRGETVEQAMAREIMEETSLKVCESHYLMSHPNQYSYRGMVAAVIDLFYTARVLTPANIALAADELDHYEWVHPTDQHLDAMAFPSNRRAIEYWLENDRR